MKKRITTTIDEELLYKLKVESAKLQMNVNEVLEELIKMLLAGEIKISSRK